MKKLWICLLAVAWMVQGVAAAEPAASDDAAAEQELEDFMRDARERNRQSRADQVVDEEDVAVDAVVHRKPDSVFRFEAGGGLMAGHTTYQIGGAIREPGDMYSVHFPISELEFPMDVAVVEVGAGGLIRERWDVNFNVMFNITQDSGNMKDSDWITIADPSQLDIYSESECDLTAVFTDVDLQYLFLLADDLRVGAGVGFMVQSMEFECRLIEQWSPSGLAGFDFVGDGGIGITYDIVYVIPYLELSAEAALGSALRLGGRVGFSPYLTAEDEDNHQLRVPAIKAKGDYDGYAVIASGDGELRLSDTWYLRAELSYVMIRAEGDQDNSELGVWTHSTDAELESDQLKILGLLGMEF